MNKRRRWKAKARRAAARVEARRPWRVREIHAEFIVNRGPVLVKEAYEVCQECDGRGEYLDAPQRGQGTYMQRCHVCHGTGISSRGRVENAAAS